MSKKREKFNVKDLNFKNQHLKNHPILRAKLTLSQRAADKLTAFVGSWEYISFIAVLLIVWISINVIGFVKHWDPFPFILLNLILSCLAAIQEPIILMSQNRQVERDRISAKYDYKVNRKAEREVRDMQKDLDEIKALIRKYGYKR